MIAASYSRIADVDGLFFGDGERLVHLDEDDAISFLKDAARKASDQDLT
jgi:hypothetical protein